MPTEWTCVTTGATSNCTVTASSTVGLYNGANFSEWLFMSGVFLFFISYMLWGRFWRPIKALYED